MEILHCAILLAVLVQAQGEVPVEGLESVEVREGEEAILSCTTPSDILFCTFRSPTDETFTMAKSIPYEEGRIVYHGTDEKRECGMKITNVKEKDNGEWKCLVSALLDGNAKTGEKSAIITVAKPPTDIHIEVDGVTTASVIVNYSENKERKVKCVAAGGRPAASFSWMLGKDPFKGTVADIENTENEDGTSTQAQVLTYEPQPLHNGKQLTCIVNHSGFSDEQVSSKQNAVTLDLDVQFAPVDADQPKAFYNLVIGKEQAILINFRAHPKPTEIHWAIYDKTEVAAESESLDGRFKAEQLKPGPNDGFYTARLIINPVKPEDAGTTSELVVTNPLGTTKYSFTLSIGDKPASAPAVSDSLDGGVPSPTESGSGPVIVIVIVAILIIVVIVVAVFARSQGMLCFADPPKTEEDKEKAVEKEEGSDTESAEHVEGAKDEKDTASVEDGTLTNNNNKKSVTARVSSLLTAMKKTVGSKKDKYAESESEVKLQESEEKKDSDEEDSEKKDDSIVYADLDKSAMSEGTRPSVTVENEMTEYAEIKPQAKE